MELPNIFGYIGVATVGVLLVRLLQELYVYLRPSSLSRYRTPGKETWAFVSGASDGIGFGFAQELCQRGFNVFLHGRNRDKLLRIQEQLRTSYPTAKTKIIVFDALKPNEDMDHIVREIGDAHLTVLINNVGGQGCLIEPPYVRLQNLTYKQMNDVITLNAVFMTNLTRLLLPTLVKNAPGLVMNISSASSFGLPWLTVYAGTKGFVNSFTKALAAEIRAEGEDVEVLGVIVGSVKTPGNDVDEGIFIPPARTMASASLDRVGSGSMVSWGYWLHRIQGLGFDILPLKVMQGIVADVERELYKKAIENAKRE